jgi:hypothetical protein
MNFDSSYVFPEFSTHEEDTSSNDYKELQFVCKSCRYHFINDTLKPFYLPCSDLICENCLNEAKLKEDFNCPECQVHFEGSELNKIQFNKEILSLIKKNVPKIPSKKFSYLNISRFGKEAVSPVSVCPNHSKEHLDNLYCFYHKKKLCSDCLIEHKYSKCNIKKWTDQDSNFLVKELKTKFIKISDHGNTFNDHLTNVEASLSDQKQNLKLDIFHDHLNLVNSYNRITEENNFNRRCDVLNDKSFLFSSIELTTYVTLCKKLQAKTILTNPKCLKFISNNFKIPFEKFFVENTINNFPNLLIHAYNKYNDDAKFFIKYNEDFYLVENLFESDTKLILIDTSLTLGEEHETENEYEILLNINSTSYKYYDIFIFHNILQLLPQKGAIKEYFTNNVIKTFYFNDKHFVFDFLNIIEVNNNYLKITFRPEEAEICNNVYIKITKYSSLSEFVFDFFILDTHPIYFCKAESKLKIIQEDGYFKSMVIPKELEVKNGIIRIYADKGPLSGKIESIEYFRLINC